MLEPEGVWSSFIKGHTSIGCIPVYLLLASSLYLKEIKKLMKKIIFLTLVSLVSLKSDFSLRIVRRVVSVTTLKSLCAMYREFKPRASKRLCDVRMPESGYL